MYYVPGLLMLVTNLKIWGFFGSSNNLGIYLGILFKFKQFTEILKNLEIFLKFW